MVKKTEEDKPLEEKIEGKKTEESKRKIAEKKSKKQEKQIKIAIILMVVLIILIFLIKFAIQSMGEFEYAGIRFKKQKIGDLILYASQFPVKNKITGEVIGEMPFYFRTDPRKTEGIYISQKIRLNKDIILAIGEKYAESCDDSILAGSTLSLFLNSIGANVSAGTLNQTEAEKLDRTYITCDDPKYSVVVFQESENNLNSIKNERGCYFLNIANCDLMNVTERFILGTYAHSNRIEL